MRRKREKAVLSSGLWHSDRPRIPREWLLPERLHATLGANGLKQSSPVVEDDLRAWLSFLGARSTATIQENWSQAVHEVHHPSPLDLLERLRQVYGVDELCAAGAVYCWGRAWHRYDAEVKVDLARRTVPERKAIKSWKPAVVLRDLRRCKEEAGSSLNRDLKETAKKAMKGLAKLLRILHGNPGEDGYLMSCASGLRARQSSLSFLRGWVKAYGDDSSADFGRINRGGSKKTAVREMVEGGDRHNIDGALLRVLCDSACLAIRPRVGVGKSLTGGIEMVEGGDRHNIDGSLLRMMGVAFGLAVRPGVGIGKRLTVGRVPRIERPEFVDAEAWLVPLCLWSDTALAKFGGLGMKDAGRAAADRIRALELDRPGFYVVGLSKTGRVVRLPKSVKRKTVSRGRT